MWETDSGVGGAGDATPRTGYVTRTSDHDEAAGLRVLRELGWAALHVLALLAAFACIGAGLAAR